MKILFLGFYVTFLCSCFPRPDIETEGLHKDCTIEQCAGGQKCVTAASSSGDTKTCEIECDSDSGCPDNYRCNLPPIAPDSIPNVCVEN